MTEPTAHHAGITVADLDGAIEFYAGTFGFEVLAEFTVSGEAFADAVDVADATGRAAHLDADGVRVELFEYEPTGEPLEDPELNRSGATHLGFGVEDVDTLYAELDDDVETLSEPRTTSTGTRILFLRDPEGNLVELIET